MLTVVHSPPVLTIHPMHAKGCIRKRVVKMKSTTKKSTHAIIAIVICWFLAYGVSTAAIHCCPAITDICSPSGVRGPMMPVSDVHCQASPSYYLTAHQSAGEVAGSVWHESNEPTTCCPAPHCAPFGFTAHPGQSPPSLPWLQESGNSVTSDSDHSFTGFSHIRHTLYNSKIQIFLLTKSIIR